MFEKTIITVGLAALLMAGCGDDEESAPIIVIGDDDAGVVDGADAGTDASAPPADVGVEPDVPAEPGSLSVEPSFLSFSGVKIDETQEATITFSNTGGSPVFVGGAQIVEENRVGNPEFVPGASWPSQPLYIEPGTFEQVSVRYAPHDYASDRGRVQFTTNDPQMPMVTIPIDTINYYRDLVAPRFVRFGAVELDEPGVQMVILRNAGMEALRIEAVEISGTNFSYSVLGGETLPTVLDHDEDLGLEVVYDADDHETQLGTLTITSDDPDEGSFAIALRANDPAPCLSAGPASVELSASPGSTASRQVTVLNCGGSSPLHIASVELDDPTGTFSLSGLPTLPVEVLPRSTTSFTVSGSLAEAGEIGAEVVVTASNAGATPLVVPVRLVVP